MKIVQIRHAGGRLLNEFHEDTALMQADDFVTEDRARQIIAFHTHSEEKPCPLLSYVKWPSAKIFRVMDIAVDLAPRHIEDAPDYRPMGPFVRTAIRIAARPQTPAKGYPRTKVTVLIRGKPCNVTFKIVPAEDAYDWPCWALA